MKTTASVLIIEDDKWFRQYLEKTISKAGYLVTSTGNSYEAIDMIDNNLPSIIVLDILLPGTNGVGLLNEIASYSDTRTIPIIICSSIADSLPRSNLDKYGVKVILDKATMKPEDLIAGLNTVIK